MSTAEDKWSELIAQQVVEEVDKANGVRFIKAPSAMHPDLLQAFTQLEAAAINFEEAVFSEDETIARHELMKQIQNVKDTRAELA